MIYRIAFLVVVAGLVGCSTVAQDPESGPDFVRGSLITFTGDADTPNGAWCWFQDERVIVDASHPDEPIVMFTAISASVADSTEQGDLDLHWYGLDTGNGGSVELYDRLGQDDHNVAALYQLDSGEVMALYARHGNDKNIYVTRSSAHNPSNWTEAEIFRDEANVTYNNLLTAGVGDNQKLYNFSRSRGWNPNFLVLDTPDDDWKYGGRLLASEGRPYLKYVGNSDGSLIHVVATDQHPRDFDNSIYHGVMDGVSLYDSRGNVLDHDLSDQDAVSPTALTEVFKGDPDNVAWMADVAVDKNDQPVIAFSVQKDGRDKPPNSGGLDHRYHLARLTANGWQQHEIAFAGERLYSFEDDYTGLVAIDPQDVNHVVISTNADPDSGAPLISTADQKRHYEIFEGTSKDGGKTFSWEALTRNSTVDNIRPIIPAWDNERRVVLWMRGSYSSYTEFDTQVVGIIQRRDGWVYEIPSLWSETDDMLELKEAGPAFDGIRRPFSVAYLAETEDLADFSFSAQVKSTQNVDVVGRDVVVVFGYRSSEEFYYAHLSNDNTVMPHNGIFIVNQEDRRRIDDQGLDNPPPARLIDSDWHQIRIDRNTETGRTEVFMDDLRSPLMTMTDKTFSSGAIGFGSFDDTGAIAGIHLVAGEGPVEDPISERVVEGSLTLKLESFATIPASDTTGGPMARINYLNHANDGSGRLFVNDLRGKMYVINSGNVTEYFDLRAQMPDFVDAPGLGSGFGFFAFHPDFAQNGKLYTIHTEAGAALENQAVDYSNSSGDSIQGVLTEWTTSSPEAAVFQGSSREVLRLGFQSHLHGMQQMAFDPNAQSGDLDYGLLYIGVGDGESPGSQTNNPQSLSAHTGKFLRIDPLGRNSPNGQYGIPSENPFVGTQGALGEIWALGLRNPHRFSWDAQTRNMYIGHIGEAKLESIFPGQAGANYGWNLREGGFRYEKDDPRAVYPELNGDNEMATFTEPVIRLDHDELAALVGGFVYRGDQIPALNGTYLFGDIVFGHIFYVDASDLSGGGTNDAVRRAVLVDVDGVVYPFEHFAEKGRTDLRFGQDADGEIYVLSKANGSVWKIVSASQNGAR
jgi:glucose/arabinose dehydrogenase